MMIDNYEVYPGHTAKDFAEDFLSRSPISLQAFCKNERIDPSELPRLVESVLTEWFVKEEKHHTRREALNHLINHIRIKSQYEQRTNHTQAAGALSVYADRYSELERAADSILFNASYGNPTQND